MPKPRLQRAIELIAYLGAGIVALGVLLDALSNTVSLITPERALIGSGILVAFWVAAEINLRRHGLLWQISDGSQVRITALGIGRRLSIIGMLLLLWIPQIVRLTDGGTSRQADPVARRLRGVILASRQATRDAAFGIQQRIEMAELLMKQHPNAPIETFSYFGLSPLNLPKILPTILADGDLYQAASPAFRERLPHFVNSITTYEAALDLRSNKPENLGTLKLLLWELRTQVRCLELEEGLLLGRISTEEHEREFRRVLNGQANQLRLGQF